MKDKRDITSKINELKLEGSKIQLECAYKRRILKPEKNFNLQEKSNVVSETRIIQGDVKKNSGVEKKECKLKINRIDKVEVYNEQIKKIHETIEVKDFQRLLETFKNNGYCTKEFELFNCDLTKYVDIYDELYGQYYKNLKEWDVFDEIL